MKNIRIAVRLSLAVLLIALAACSRSCQKGDVVAEVGDYQLSKKDVELRDKMIAVYYPENKASYGLTQLVSSYTYAQILKNHGREITPDVLKAEEERINTSTRAPEVLERIKSIFKDDHDSYLKIFILPTFADRVIYFDFFLKTPEFHLASKTKAEEFLKMIRSKPEKLREEAEKLGLVVSKFKVSLSGGLEWESPDKQKKQGPDLPPAVQERMKEQETTQISQEGQIWMKELESLKKGEVGPNLMERQDVWAVVRYLGPNPKQSSARDMEIVAFPKADYDAWLKAETEKVPVKYR